MSELDRLEYQVRLASLSWSAMLSGWAQKWRGVQDFSLGAPGLRIRRLAVPDAPHGATGRMRTWGEVADRGASRHAGRARHAVCGEMSALVVSQFSC